MLNQYHLQKEKGTIFGVYLYIWVFVYLLLEIFQGEGTVNLGNLSPLQHSACDMQNTTFEFSMKLP